MIKNENSEKMNVCLSESDHKRENEDQNECLIVKNEELTTTEQPNEYEEKIQVKIDDCEYEFCEVNAVIEEEKGEIDVFVVTNDNSKENLVILTSLRTIFQKQLPKMPKEYISRLVFDRHHLSIAIVKKQSVVLGGITFRLFQEKNFVEIVFCAISSTEQVKGYGAHLMNHFKDYLRSSTSVEYFLTYADNYAIGYFKKQGFSKTVTLDKSQWVGYIKDYEGGTLMEFKMMSRFFRYLDLRKILFLQRIAIEQKIKMRSQSHIVRKGLQFFKNFKKDMNEIVDPKRIPGLLESGWLEEMDKLAQKPKKSPYHKFMTSLFFELEIHPSAWPFVSPVNKEEVTDYYEIIKNPMDLSTIEQNLENDKYTTFELFLHDVRLIFKNCRAYNSETTTYYKNANKLEKFFNSKIKENSEYAHYLDLK